MGIQTPAELRQTRDAEITDYQGPILPGDMRQTHMTAYQAAILWALQMKPGVVPVNGSPKRTARRALARLFAIQGRRARQANPRARFGRYTPPKPPQAGNGGES